MLKNTVTLKSASAVTQSHGTMYIKSWYHLKTLVRFPIRIPQQLYGRIYSRFDTIHERDRQTPHDGIGRAYMHRAAKIDK